MIWFGIFASAWSVVLPESQSNNYYFNLAIDERVRDLMIGLWRGYCIVSVGFLISANVGGLQIKNVAMVFVVTLAESLNWFFIGSVPECGGGPLDVWCPVLWALAPLR